MKKLIIVALFAAFAATQMPAVYAAKNGSKSAALAFKTQQPKAPVAPLTTCQKVTRGVFGVAALATAAVAYYLMTADVPNVEPIVEPIVEILPNATDVSTLTHLSNFIWGTTANATV